MQPGESNHFDGASSHEEGWHAHDGGQFILVESGISHLRTELGAWVVPARRVAWGSSGRATRVQIKWVGQRMGCFASRCTAGLTGHRLRVERLRLADHFATAPGPIEI
jgi:hypothetical protein